MCVYEQDRIVSSPYVIVYFHTNVEDENQPALDWLKDCYEIFNRKYKKNLQKLYVVHSTMWVRTLVWYTPLPPPPPPPTKAIRVTRATKATRVTWVISQGSLCGI